MKTIMERNYIIQLKLKGWSNRKIHEKEGIDRKTVADIWNYYILKQKELLNAAEEKIPIIQDSIINGKKYDSSNRVKKKYTDEIDTRIDELLESEQQKLKDLGETHKQKLTGTQIYEILIEEGYDIGLTTVTNNLRKKREAHKETFIKQLYEYGDRLEYDFGEVKLLINGIYTEYYIAVISSPKSNFRWAYLYNSQNKEVFMDSHLKIFKKLNGIYKEIVYDNMRNVVTKFIGRNEKELNKDLVNLSLYYGFKINVTNCFSGNEKGHVEGSVKFIRNKVFAKNYKFKSFEEAKIFLENNLIKLNEKSDIEEEKKHLLPIKPDYELGIKTSNVVSKYSFIRVENNFYSVPEYLTGRSVEVFKYIDKVMIYSNNKLVCTHKKIDGINKESVDINHYLDTLLKKPGAIKNSAALKSIPNIKHIYDTYFTTYPKKFILYLKKYSNLSVEELENRLLKIIETKEYLLEDVTNNDENNLLEDNILSETKKNLKSYTDLAVGGKK